MAKTQLKYITKDNNELKNFRGSIKNNVPDFDITKFLLDDSNFGLLVYKFSKVSSAIFISNDSNNKKLNVINFFYINKEDILDIVDFLFNKFNYYSFNISNKLVSGVSFKKYLSKKDNEKTVIEFKNYY